MAKIVTFLYPATDEIDDPLAPSLEWILAQAILEAMRRKQSERSMVQQCQPNEDQQKCEVA
jgi:hypothetical protein